jgi:hypothetical protein
MHGAHGHSLSCLSSIIILLSCVTWAMPMNDHQLLWLCMLHLKQGSWLHESRFICHASPRVCTILLSARICCWVLTQLFSLSCPVAFKLLMYSYVPRASCSSSSSYTIHTTPSPSGQVKKKTRTTGKKMQLEINSVPAPTDRLKTAICTTYYYSMSWSSSQEDKKKRNYCIRFHKILHTCLPVNPSTR